MFDGIAGAEELYAELQAEYLPRYDEAGRQIVYGFYSTLAGELAGLSLLAIDDWEAGIGNTGADTLPHMRGRGVAPGSKPHLFALGFGLLGLKRIDTGCEISNLASKRSIEKTPGFVYTGIERAKLPTPGGESDEDCYMYTITREDWQRLYDAGEIVAE